MDTCKESERVYYLNRYWIGCHKEKEEEEKHTPIEKQGAGEKNYGRKTFKWWRWNDIRQCRMGIAIRISYYAIMLLSEKLWWYNVT